MPLPEGFEVVSTPSTKSNQHSALPEGFEVVSTPQAPAKRGLISRAISAVDTFIKDPVGNIIGKREPKEISPQPHKQQPAPQQKPDPVNTKGTTPWDNLMEPSQKIDARFVTSDPAKVKAAIDADAKAKDEKRIKLDRQLGDAPAEDDTLNTVFTVGGLLHAAKGVASTVAGKILKSKDLAEDGVSAYTKGSAFAAGDAAGQVGAVVGMEGADAAMSDEFKKNHETAAELIKAGTGLVLGGVAGYKAEAVRLNQAQTAIKTATDDILQSSSEALGIELPKAAAPKDEAIAKAIADEYDVPKAPVQHTAEEVTVVPKAEDTIIPQSSSPEAQAERVRIAHEEAMARKAKLEEETSLKADIETINAHPRLQELIDMRRDVSAKQAERPNIRESDRQILHENHGGGYETKVIPAYDVKNYDHDFALTKGDIQAYEKNGMSPALVDKFKKDLDVLDNNPLYRSIDENPPADLGRVEGDKFIDETGAEIDIPFSHGEAAAEVHTLESIGRSLSESLGEPLSVKLSPIMSTVSKADIPEAVLAQARGDIDGIHGFVHEGKAYIVADNIPQEWSAAQVRGLVMHEVGVHLRKAGMEDKEFGKILSHLKQSEDPLVKEAYARIPKETAIHRIDEEALAYLIQAHPESTVARRVIAWVKQQLIRMGISPSGLKLTPADLSAMAWGAVKQGKYQKISDDLILLSSGNKAQYRAKIEMLESHLEGKELTAEQARIAKVYMGKSNIVEMKTYDIDTLKDTLYLSKGDNSKGARHIIFKHFGEETDSLSADELVSIVDIIRKGDVKLTKTRRIYTHIDEDGIRLRVVVDEHRKNGNDFVVSFYSNRKGSAGGHNDTGLNKSGNSADNESVHQIEADSQDPVFSRANQGSLFDGNSNTDTLFDHAGIKIEQGTDRAAQELLKTFSSSGKKTSGVQGDLFTTTEAHLLSDIDAPIEEVKQTLQELSEGVTPVNTKLADEIVSSKEYIEKTEDMIVHSNPVLEDVGEKIEGARKDLWTKHGMSIEEIRSLSGGEQHKYATKEYVWGKPNYEEMVSSGIDAKRIALYKILRDKLAAKPMRDSAEYREAYVTAINTLKNTMDEFLAGNIKQSEIQTHILNQLGYAKERLSNDSGVGQILFSLYKGRTSPLVFKYADERKAEEMIRKGFPTIDPVYKSYVIDPYRIDGSIKFVVQQKGVRGSLGKFDTKEEAVEFAKGHLEQKSAGGSGTATKPVKQVPVRPHIDFVQRIGEEIRAGKDVGADDFMNDFGFRGVQFGNWAVKDERQKIINHAFDGMHDLANVLGLPPKAMSLDGKLGMAFGARGTARGVAHYEPSQVVINMTKIKGAGAMAHEWGHALDHYFGELGTAAPYGGSPKGISGWDSKYAQGNTHIRPEMQEAFKEVMDAIFKKEVDKAEVIRKYELSLEKALQNNRPAEYVKVLEERLNSLRQNYVPEYTSSSFLEEAKRIDGGAKNAYWAQPTEMFARAFEAYTEDAIRMGKNRSEYLVNGTDNIHYDGQLPYPDGMERDAINRAFDKLFQTMKTKETDAGTTQLYTHGADNLAVAFASGAETDEDGNIVGIDMEKFIIGLGGYSAAKALLKHGGAGAMRKGAIDIIPDAPKSVPEGHKTGGFYSVAEQAIRSMPNKMDSEAFIKYLKNNGVKDDEILHSGIAKAIEGKESITKAEIEGAFGNPGIDTKVKGIDNSEMDQYVKNLDDEANQYLNALDPADREVARKMMAEPNPELLTSGTYDKEWDMLVSKYPELDHNTIHDVQDYKGTISPNDTTKYRGYSLQGVGENYREELTTLSGEKQYNSSHWDEPNVLYHVRKQDTTIDGDKTLLIEELQSDWHQDGRKLGYQADGNLEAAKKWFDIDTEVWNKLDIEDKQSYYDEMIGSKKYQKRAVPEAPYSKNWHEKALKDQIDEAVKNGYGRVAWIDGATQAQRYAMSHSVDRLVYSKSHGVLQGYKDGQEVMYKSATEDELERMIGKEPAKRLMENEVHSGIHEIKGEALDIGGDGMHGFYDKILPDYARKYIKKWGAEVTKEKLPDGTEVWSFPVTKAMSEEVSTKGQSLYVQGAGAVMGVGEDEEGNLTFDPLMALAGTAGVSMAMSKSVRAALSKVAAKTESLSDSAARNLVIYTIKGADKATAGNLTKIADTLSNSSIVDYVIGHKIYKLKDYMKLREDALRSSNAGMEQAARLHLQLSELSSEAREAMYGYMSGEKNVALSPELKRTADAFITRIDNMGQEMVDEGFLSKEAYAEWKGQYLHRRYASKIKRAGDWASGKGEFAVDKVQMRGKTWNATEEEYQELLKNGEIGKVSEGKTEVLKDSDGGYKLRRDWTREERTAMGEIRDIAYSLPETVGRLAQMTEFGKMLKAVPKKYLLDQGGRSDVVMRQLGYEKLSGGRYGALNGKWVNQSIAGDLKRVSNDVMGEEHNVKKLWNDYVSAVKMTHTVYNPTAHVNNIGSNVFLQAAAGLNPLKAIKYATDGTLASRRYGRWKELDAKRVTGLGADESAELARIEADADVQLWKSLDERKMFGRSQLNEILRSYMSPSIDTTAGSALHKTSEAAKALYQGEDDVMRFAAVKQLTKDGIWTEDAGGIIQKQMDIDEAMKHANDHIIPDYSKPMSKLALTLRDSGVVPFMSWAYYSTPILLSQLRNHPTRVMAIAAGWYGLDRLMGVDPYNDETMPKGFDAQRVAIARDGNKVTGMRVSSMIPHVQLTDPANTYLEPLTSGIPQTMLGAATNYNFYFRKPITYKEGGEGAYQRVKYAVQNVLPTPDVLDKLYNIGESKILDKETRRTDRVIEPRTTAQEAASFFVNLQTYDISKQRERVRKEKLHDKKRDEKWDKKVDNAINKIERVFQ